MYEGEVKGMISGQNFVFFYEKEAMDKKSNNFRC